MHLGIGYTNDGGQTWQNAIGFDGVHLSAGDSQILETAGMGGRNYLRHSRNLVDATIITAETPTARMTLRTLANKTLGAMATMTVASPASSATDNIGLSLTDANESTMTFLEWQQLINGFGVGSNMEKIDEALTVTYDAETETLTFGG